MAEIIGRMMEVFAMLFLAVLVMRPEYLGILAVGIVAVLVALAERVSGVPPGSYMRGLGDELSALRRRRENAWNNPDEDD